MLMRLGVGDFHRQYERAGTLHQGILQEAQAVRVHRERKNSRNRGKTDKEGEEKCH